MCFLRSINIYVSVSYNEYKWRNSVRVCVRSTASNPAKLLGVISPEQFWLHPMSIKDQYKGGMQKTCEVSKVTKRFAQDVIRIRSGLGFTNVQVK